MRRFAVVHAADFPYPMPGEVYPALPGGFAGLLHPHPDSLGECDYAGEVIPGHAHIFEYLVREEMGMPNNQVDDFLQNGATLFKADHPIEYCIVGILQIASD